MSGRKRETLKLKQAIRINTSMKKNVIGFLRFGKPIVRKEIKINIIILCKLAYTKQILGN